MKQKDLYRINQGLVLLAFAFSLRGSVIQTVIVSVLAIFIAVLFDWKDQALQALKDTILPILALTILLYQSTILMIYPSILFAVIVGIYSARIYRNNSSSFFATCAISEMFAMVILLVGISYMKGIWTITYINCVLIALMAFGPSIGNYLCAKRLERKKLHRLLERQQAMR